MAKSSKSPDPLGDPAQIEIGPEVLGDYEAASRREWLVTNGIGGYASGSLAGSNTRRYHGLLVAALTPPTGRVVTLSKLEETLSVGGESFALSTNQYPGTIWPQGYRLLAAFRRFPAPTFVYRPREGVELEKAIWMIPGRNTTVVRYTLRAAPWPVAISFVPLVAWIDYHAQFHRREGFPFAWSWQEPECCLVAYQGTPPLRIVAPRARFIAGAAWYDNVEHLRELERGLDFRGDLYAPGSFEARLSPGESLTVTATIETTAAPLTEAELAERQRRLIALAGLSDPFGQQLVLAADQFVVHVPETPAIRSTIIAGYPWFTDWGRDTMISLPGLCLATGRPEVARDILAAFAGFVSRGMLPNRFPDVGSEPEYNTVDATLWYVHAVYRYLEVTGDAVFVRTLMPTLDAIIEHHLAGTRYHIKGDADGLLASGADGVQLTWMDAKVGDYVVTPRRGKAVEICALWYNARCIMAELAERFGQRDISHGRAAAQTRASFAQFIRPDGHGLFDVIEGSTETDDSIRPNQIFAVSLPFSPLDDEVARRVVDTVARHLLTPYGLRTLSPKDPHYRGRCEGDAWQRDCAYHQGTVWPWLLGPFIDAHLRVYRDPKAARELLTPLREHLRQAGIGTISEIFNGAAPFAPGGCIAQAWSVAEILRVWKRLALPDPQDNGNDG
ncbi:MAG: amylo-alpha-1,6-glucosidase [Nitrospirota bacterium]